MKLGIILWVVIMGLLGFFGLIHRNDTDEKGNFKINWRMLLMFGMFPITPIIARLCGLI